MERDHILRFRRVQNLGDNAEDIACPQTHFSSRAAGARDGLHSPRLADAFPPGGGGLGHSILGRQLNHGTLFRVSQIESQERRGSKPSVHRFPRFAAVRKGDEDFALEGLGAKHIRVEVQLEDACALGRTKWCKQGKAERGEGAEQESIHVGDGLGV